MKVLEIPLGKRTKFYRFFEMLPAIISVGAIVALILLSVFSPVAASIFVLFLVIMMFVKALAMAFRTIQGYIVYKKTSALAWSRRLRNLSTPETSLEKVIALDSSIYGVKQHAENLKRIIDNPRDYPKPDDIYHGVFVMIYNEGYTTVKPTIEAIVKSDYDLSKLIIVLAYEERGGEDTQKMIDKIVKEYDGVFKDILPIMHPVGLPDEIVGKGPNATYAGYKFADYVAKEKIDPKDVIVTTLDADNRVEKNYFPYLTYEWIMAPNRQKVAYQPVCLFTNNIWDVPAPMRVVAVGNSFWNIISSMRPHLLRNFASHAQGLEALIDMDFWSKRTIVEDGHHYYRSYFHFDGDYSVIPLKVSIGQDAVLSDGYWKSFKAQFVQVRRWAYGASDVAYVADSIRKRSKKVKFWPAFTRWVRLLDSHVTQAIVAPVVAFGGWIPLIISPDSAQALSVHELPIVIGNIQQIAMIGIAVTVFTSFLMLPQKPARYKKSRNILMVLQWVIMPITSIVYASASAYYSQIRLFLGKYLTVFDVTEKYQITEK